VFREQNHTRKFAGGMVGGRESRGKEEKQRRKLADRSSSKDATLNERAELQNESEMADKENV